jgi:hypothetical protein
MFYNGGKGFPNNMGEMPNQSDADVTILSTANLLSALDRRVDEVFDQVQTQEIWRRLIAADTDPALITSIIREVFRTVCWYQSHTTEAGFHMIGRMPKTETRILKLLLLHKAEEAEHGEWARQDFVQLGGILNEVNRPPSPEAFAVIGVWWLMARVENPFGYLGAEYLFEALTAKACSSLVSRFASRGFQHSGLRFVTEHATEDVKHAALMRELIIDAAKRYPTAGPAMLRCFDYFRGVYPIPLWNSAYARARSAAEAIGDSSKQS